MTDLMVFDNPEFGAIRTFDIAGEVWFIGNDIARALGYKNPRDALGKHVDSEDVAIRDAIDSNGRMQPTKIINESGMYALIIMSELPSAKKFKRWITKEVIPSIVKTGGYNLPQLTPNEMMLQLAQNAVELEREVKALKSRMETTEQLLLETGGKFEKAMQTFAAPRPTSWAADMSEKINALISDNNLSPVKFKGKLYAELERDAVVCLSSRQKRLQSRLKKQGATYRERQAITKLDVIGRDKQLRPIFEGIIKRYQAVSAQD